MNRPSSDDTVVTFGHTMTMADGTTLKLMTVTEGGNVSHRLILNASDEPLTQQAARELGTALMRYATGGWRLWGRQ